MGLIREATGVDALRLRHFGLPKCCSRRKRLWDKRTNRMPRKLDHSASYGHWPPQGHQFHTRLDALSSSQRERDEHRTLRSPTFSRRRKHPAIERRPKTQCASLGFTVRAPLVQEGHRFQPAERPQAWWEGPGGSERQCLSGVIAVASLAGLPLRAHTRRNRPCLASLAVIALACIHLA